nr:7280_t:CDS:2 [Entrophospora candida]
MSDMDDLLDFEDGGIDFPTNENYDLTTASTTIEKITKIEVATEEKSGDDNETLVKQDTFDFDNLEEFNINDSDFLKKKISESLENNSLENKNIDNDNNNDNSDNIDESLLKKDDGDIKSSKNLKSSEKEEGEILNSNDTTNSNNNNNNTNNANKQLKQKQKDSSQQQQTSSPQKQIPSLQAAQRHHQQQQQLHFHQMQQQQQLLILQQQQLLANQNAQNFRGRNLRKNNDWRQPNLNAGAFLNGVMSPFRPGFAPGQMIGPNIHVNPNFARLRPHVLPFGNPLMQYPGGPHMNMLPYQGQMEIPQYHPSMNPMAGRVARRQMNSSPSGANQQQRHPSSQSQTSSSSSPSKRKFPDNGFEQKESDNKRSSTSNNNSFNNTRNLGRPITKVAPQSTTPSSTGGSNSNKLIISNVDENVTKRELQALASNVPGGPLSIIINRESSSAEIIFKTLDGAKLFRRKYNRSVLGSSNIIINFS